jgi:hypothetical protein
VGLVLEASTQAAGVPGTAATWVAPTGTPAARALECGGRTSCELWVRGDRVRTEPARAGSVVFWGACCAAWPIVKALPKKKEKTRMFI